LPGLTREAKPTIFKEKGKRHLPANNGADTRRYVKKNSGFFICVNLRHLRAKLFPFVCGEFWIRLRLAALPPLRLLRFRMEGSAGGTMTGAVGTTALPGDARKMWVPRCFRWKK
jgi:hypothetical protein